MDGEVDVIVANSSFEMGIDKPNVRYVIHPRLPTSIGDYFQQCGRAGRDGLQSTCLLFYNYVDKNMLCKLFEKQGDLNSQLSSLNDLINYLENPVQCRHQSLMGYFGEQTDSFYVNQVVTTVVIVGAILLMMEQQMHLRLPSP